MNLQIGRAYRIHHARKGTFCAKVISQDATWADVEVTDGIARRMSGPHDVCGETITIRKTHFRAELLEDSP